jgi:hypothetical protein
MSNIKEKIENYLTENTLNQTQEGAISKLKDKLDTSDYVVNNIPGKGFAIVTFTKRNSTKVRYKVFEDKRPPESI